MGSNANSGHIRYLDDSANDRPFNVDRIMLYSMPAQGAIGSDDRNRHHAVFLQDTWRPTDRLSMNLGVRYEQQRTYFLDATSTPFFDGVFPTGTTAGRTNVVWNTLAPRIGVTFALAPQTVVKGHYGRYYLNLADAHAAANPGGTAWVRHAFLDPNANGLYDGPSELGAVEAEQGATGTALAAEGTPVDPDLRKEYADELSASVEHQLAADTSLRVSWVRKDVNGDSGLWNVAQQTALLEGRGISCFDDPDWACPANALTGAPLLVARVPDDVAGVVDTPHRRLPRHGGGLRHPAGGGEPALHRGVPAAGELRLAVARRVPLGRRRGPQPPLCRAPAGGLGRPRAHLAEPRPRRRLPTAVHELGGPPARPLHAAGRDRPLHQHTPPERLALRADSAGGRPGTGTNQPVFLSDISANRSDNVTLVDIRVEKAVATGGRGRLTLMADAYNLLNSNAVTNFSLRVGDDERVIAALDPIALKAGVRWQF